MTGGAGRACGLGASRAPRRLVELELPVPQPLQRLSPVAIGRVDAVGDEEAGAAVPRPLGTEILRPGAVGDDRLFLPADGRRVEGRLRPAVAGGAGRGQEDERSERRRRHVSEVSTARRASAR